MKMNKYITVAYRLETIDGDGKRELVEEAPAEHPFQFISELGFTLDAFEAEILPLEAGSKFDFTLSVEDAYGPYEDERVIKLDKKVFMVDGRFDKNAIHPGAVIPLVNDAGQRFQGLVTAVGDEEVEVDLNHPLAGCSLHFTGEVITSRPATNEEIQGTLTMMSGEGCGCGCDHGDGEHECCGGHHDHGDGEHECCGGHHHHNEGDKPHQCCGRHHH